MANPLFKISMGLDKDLPNGKVPGQVYVTTDKKKMHIDVDGDTRITLNAAEADKLTTAQSVQVNLASTSPSSFDGTAGINPGVTGVLKVGNGGTGASDHVANRLVWSASASKIRASDHYANESKVGINYTSEPTTNFYVNGTSEFSDNITINGDDNVDRFLIFDSKDASGGYNWRLGYLGTGAGEANYLVIQSSKTDGVYSNALRFGLSTLDAAFGGNVYPLTNNTKTLGTSSLKWATIYATQLEGNAKSATQLITERVLKIGNTGKTFNGTKDVTWTNNEIGFLDLINRGTELADEADMNDVGYGNFYSNNSTKSGTLVNGPLTSAGFRLISMRGYNSSATAYHWQYAVTSSRTIYQRFKGSGDWSEWGTIVLNPTKNQLGSATQPVYIGSSGTAIACTAYSGLLTAFTSSTNTLSITVGGTTKTAKAVNSVSNTWTGGTTAGPTLKTTVNGVAGTAVAIPAASSSASGIVTTGAQTFAGNKTFNSATYHKGNIYLVKSSLTKGTIPSEATYSSIMVLDNANSTAAGHRQSMIQSFVNTSGTSSIRMYAYQWAADSTANSYIYVQETADGTGRAGSSAPFYGAVWNDYAEFRMCNEDFKPGQVVLENGDDTLSIASQRLQRGCSIISDTFGFAIGETDEAKCPIAVSGRVLAYGYESREEFKKHIGQSVCSGPNGTVSIMTEEEEEKYPSRIIGTISAVPDYEEWGTGNIKVNNRIWIKVK